MEKSPFTIVELRAYMAAVVGGFRAPFGKRGSSGALGIGQSKLLAQNTTKERVINVTVSRSDLAGATANVVFFQSSAGGGSANDFLFTFNSTDSQRFVLQPGEQLSVQILSGGPVANFVVGQETY